MVIRIAATRHVETVVLLSQLKPDDKIEIDLNLDELDLTSSESKATYKKIKQYVDNKYGLKNTRMNLHNWYKIMKSMAK